MGSRRGTNNLSKCFPISLEQSNVGRRQNDSGHENSIKLVCNKTLESVARARCGRLAMSAEYTAIQGFEFRFRAASDSANK